jgi:hypothetical protein
LKDLHLLLFFVILSEAKDLLFVQPARTHKEPMVQRKSFLAILAVLLTILLLGWLTMHYLGISFRLTQSTFSLTK